MKKQNKNISVTEPIKCKEKPRIGKELNSISEKKKEDLTQKVKIIFGPFNQARVYIDDKEIKHLAEVNINNSAHEFSAITLKLFCVENNLDIEYSTEETITE